jgi:hypothetical protein
MNGVPPSNRRVPRWIVGVGVAALAALGSAASAQTITAAAQPVFDVHLHASFTADASRAMLSMLDSLNITHAMYIGSFDQLSALPDTSGRLIPGLMFPCAGGRMPNAGVQCFPNGTNDLPDLGWLRSQVRAGRIRVFGEIGAQYLGMAPNDPRLEPYYALAEELDVPVGIHLGIGPPGVAYADSPFPPFKSPNYRGAAGDPYLLEDVLVKHPQLRLYVMHAAWPDIDHMLYMLCMHPRLYADISVLQYAIARPAYLTALKTLVDAGMSDRLMYGSDGGPRFESMGIDAIEHATFLTDAQKGAILYDNAMRFFRIGPQSPTKVARVCGG